MIKLCGWCGESLDGTGDDPVPLTTFLDALEAPVLLVTEDVEVRKTNTRARELVGKTEDALRGLLGGEVFDCVYAALPEGCGRTVHCSGCTIRRSVGHTFSTGEALERIPATLRRRASDEEPRDTEIYVTTRKVEGRVLLRIDRG